MHTIVRGSDQAFEYITAVFRTIVCTITKVTDLSDNLPQSQDLVSSLISRSADKEFKIGLALRFTEIQH